MPIKHLAISYIVYIFSGLVALCIIAYAYVTFVRKRPSDIEEDDDTFNSTDRPSRFERIKVPFKLSLAQSDFAQSYGKYIP
uniref:Transmembrane protein n=1 Tax=Steinernema glaseri TaxID=37863 RepID=A0A1I8A8P0_9BILA